MYIKLFSALSILLFTFDCNAFSKAPNADGVVSIRMVNNNPCLYIEKIGLIGAYFIDISQVFQKIWIACSMRQHLKKITRLEKNVLC